MNYAAPAVAHYAALLAELAFRPEGNADDNPGWYRKENVRVVIDDQTPSVYALDPSGSYADWSITLRGAPTGVLLTVIREALTATRR